MRILFLLFVVVPLLEIFLLIRIGAQIGALATIAWLLLAGVLGVLVLRLQGVLTVLQAREMMARGEAPAAALGHGVLLALAGILLIIPGFISDIVAFLLLIPALRGWLLGRWARRIQVSTHYTGRIYEGEVAPDHGETPQPGRTLEGDYTRKDD